LQPLGPYVNGLLLAAIGTVAHQAFTNHIRGYSNLILTAGKWLTFF